MTAEQVMAKAFLGGWMVRKIALQGVETTPDGVSIIECPDKRMTVRTKIVTGATEYLGIVNRPITPPCRTRKPPRCSTGWWTSPGPHFETAGSLRGGRMVLHHG